MLRLRGLRFHQRLQLMRLRAVEEIIGGRGPGVIPRATATEFVDLLGEEVAAALIHLHGTESSGDIAWCLTVDLAVLSLAEELGEDAPYRVIAESGAGDSWAIHTGDLTVVFLDHDRWGDESDIVMHTRLDVLDFIRAADAWAQAEVHFGGEEERAMAEFAALLQSLPGATGKWPYLWDG
ncbi:MAG: hypothetical protein Q4D89_08650 [Arachnia propionica]|uniref:hypothetical protein n=1 Tax=Arachnia propionica TaxID=1750 RepID=UPI0026FF6A70|nr:hypothetical protein [Arachnia propionica]